MHTCVIIEAGEGEMGVVLGVGDEASGMVGEDEAGLLLGLRAED